MRCRVFMLLCLLPLPAAVRAQTPPCLHGASAKPPAIPPSLQGVPEFDPKTFVESPSPLRMQLEMTCAVNGDDAAWAGDFPFHLTVRTDGKVPQYDIDETRGIFLNGLANALPGRRSDDPESARLEVLISAAPDGENLRGMLTLSLYRRGQMSTPVWTRRIGPWVDRRDRFAKWRSPRARFLFLVLMQTIRDARATRTGRP